MNVTWSKPYYGIQHSNRVGLHRCTVIEYPSFTLLHKWYAGCQFNPIEEQYDSLMLAKSAAESWLAK